MPTITPLQWIPWRAARNKMGEVWPGWARDSDLADKTMVNALRLGRVPYRGQDGFDAQRRRVRLADILPAAQGILLGGSTAVVRYTKRESLIYAPFSPAPLSFAELPPQIVDAAAKFCDPELAWDEFRDELIRFWLPAGATPGSEGAHQKSDETTKATEPPIDLQNDVLRPAAIDAINQAIRRAYDEAGDDPPNVNAVVKPVQRGPKPGTVRRYEAEDRALFREIKRLTRNGAQSVWAACLKLACGEIAGKTVAGAGSAESRAKRLMALYNKARRRLTH